MAELIISVSGLRGIVGETLTAEVAGRYAAAFAATLPPGDILVGAIAGHPEKCFPKPSKRDSRPRDATPSTAASWQRQPWACN